MHLHFLHMNKLSVYQSNQMSTYILYPVSPDHNLEALFLFLARLLDQMRGDDDADDINDFMPSDCTFRFTKILEDSDLTNKVSIVKIF